MRLSSVLDNKSQNGKDSNSAAIWVYKRFDRQYNGCALLGEREARRIIYLTLDCEFYTVFHEQFRDSFDKEK